MKYFKIIYNSLLWSIVVAITCFKSEWLEMRVNVGYILLGCLILFSIILSIYFRKKEFKLNIKFTIINLVICVAYAIISYGLRRIAVVPASIIREGLNMTRIPFSTVNTILLIVLFLGLVIILLAERRENNKNLLRK